MKIDTEIEPAVREALAAAVAGEADQFNKATGQIGERGDDFALEAVHLGLAVGITALYSVHEGRRPDDEQLAELAGAFEETEFWAGIDPGKPLRFLTALADGTPITDVVPLEDSALLTFAVCGWLLSAFLPEEAEWTDFLDQILERLESEPTWQ
jgi:hypothetical protein